MQIIIRLEMDDHPSVQDVIDYINDLGEDLYFETDGECEETVEDLDYDNAMAREERYDYLRNQQ